MSKILIVAAVENETLVLTRKLRLTKSKNNPLLYHGTYHQHEIDLIEVGIGKVNTALNLSRAITQKNYDYALNLGSAGGTKSFKQGDKIIVSQAKYHDFDLQIFGYKKGQVPGYPEYFMVPHKEINDFKALIPTLKESLLYSGDRFVETSPNIDEEYVVDMEATAFFQVLYLSGIKAYAFKIVSDIINGSNYDTYSSFEEKKIGNYLYDFFLEIIEGIK
ncbi:MAG: 5'-methylthioadenosine/S-adenosylhomocysteine nucleosidase [Acholeplasmatales bacterium]|jgi:adenosylhomocysteine nucleosidase|nr:5'-methylthioadenosine/S-adenosylhomocysteine nucleosidase [Acholeplasmatales bacterium]